MAIDALKINDRLTIPGSDLSLEFARAGGPGGQHVNTTDTAVRLRFALRSCAVLHPAAKARIREARAGDITKEGDLLITSQRSRSRLMNIDDARDKLAATIRAHLLPPRPRKPTKPTKASKRRRLKSKTRRGELKKGRGKVRKYEG